MKSWAPIGPRVISDWALIDEPFNTNRTRVSQSVTNLEWKNSSPLQRMSIMFSDTTYVYKPEHYYFRREDRDPHSTQWHLWPSSWNATGMPTSPLRQFETENYIYHKSTLYHQNHTYSTNGNNNLRSYYLMQYLRITGPWKHMKCIHWLGGSWLWLQILDYSLCRM